MNARPSSPSTRLRPAVALAPLAGALALSVACGPPAFIDDTDKIDNWLSRGNFEYACQGLRQEDDHLREHTAKKLADYPAEPVASACLCETIYDAETGSWDPVIATALASSRHEAAVSCLVPAATDARVKDKAALASALGATLTEAGYGALEQLARQSSEASVRGAALTALKPSRAHEGFLADVLATDADSTLRAAAAEALAGREDATVRKALLTAVRSDPAPEVRAAALRTFGEATHIEVVRATCDALLGDAEASVRVVAAEALAGTKSATGAQCLAKKLAAEEPDGGVREALLASARSSPREEISKALCDQIGPWLRRYVKDRIASEIAGFDIIEAQNNQHWEASYACVEKALGQSGYSCYARNYLGHWFRDLGGKAATPWCPGMVKVE
ncbi:MAG: HEAT repeat domain-containing protein [Alphaproteobacteria bacterium]|nr:HEAT repeat domain-containing protein [Alphaproteobacteria bacterium]